jgi:hypothetical protein
MDLTAPQNFTATWEMIVAVIGFFVASSGYMVFAYAKLLRIMTARFDANDKHIAVLKVEITSMKLRNEKADAKTEALDQNQRTQENTIAVMANDTTHVREAMIRLEKSVADLGIYLRESNTKRAN